MAFIMTTPDDGVYLGSCAGLGFWSKLDTAGQNAAVSFETVDDAWEHFSSWDNQSTIDHVHLLEITPDLEDGYVSMAACVNAGIQPWFIERFDV